MNPRAFWLILRKEMRELLRPRYLLPILAMPLVFVAMGQGFAGFGAELAETPHVGVVDHDDGQYGRLVAASIESNADVVYSSSTADASTALNETKAAGGDAVVVIPEDFSESINGSSHGHLHVYSSIDSVGIASATEGAKVQGLVAAASQQVTLAVTGATPQQLNPIVTDHTTYVKGDEVQATPGEISGAFTSRFLFVPIIIMMVILLSGQMVMNSMAGEKENKTLETLLTMPVKRRTIVAAKLVGSASIGLVAAGLYTASIFYYQSSFPSMGDGQLSFQLSMAQYGLVAVSLFLALVGVLALTLSLGTFAGDRQGAQMLLFPLSILAIIPMFVTLFTDVSALPTYLQVLLYAIPFTHPIVAPKQLLFGDATVVLAGIGYELAFAAVAIGVAVWLFNSDKLVTGSTGRLGNLLSRIQR